MLINGQILDFSLKNGKANLELQFVWKLESEDGQIGCILRAKTEWNAIVLHSYSALHMFVHLPFWNAPSSLGYDLLHVPKAPPPHYIPEEADRHKCAYLRNIYPFLSVTAILINWVTLYSRRPI